MKIRFLFLIGVFAVLQAESAPQCHRGWILYKKNCYYFSTSAVSFKEAMVACYNLGAQLLEIEDRQEEKWVDLQCRIRGYTHGTWLGFSDIQREDHFVSLTDARKRSYANWIRGEPNNWKGKEHCAIYWVDRKGWNDTQCLGKINYACRKSVHE